MSAPGRGPSVAILLPSLKFGGAERVALTLARALTARGCRVTILLMSFEGELLGEAQREWEVVDLKCGRTKLLPGRLATYLGASPTDILLSSFWKLNLCACLARVRFPRLRLLLWEHAHPSASPNNSNFLFATSASIFYRLATRIVCVSSGVARDVLALTIGLRRKIVVISNPVPPPTSAAPRVAPAVKQIAWVGRLDQEKNPRLMIEAFAMIADRIDADLLFIGDGEMRAELVAMAGRSGLADRIRFAGFQTDPGVLLSNCELLVSTSDWEGFGNVLVEALHHGLPIVSTDSGGGAEDIIDGSNFGTMVPRGDARAVGEAIIAELSAPRDADHQRSGARRFLPDAIARQFLAAAGFGDL
jgi:glycosyltransferase involved in cell wall biosynthesis